MENDLHLLVVEQQKTNELLSHLVTETDKRNRREKRHFWIGLIWHTIPIVLTILFIWQTYTYINQQVTDIKEKVNHTFDLNNLKQNIGTLFN